ncbi:MAG: hypothetical protein HY706_19365 [Candidatus Hydrogenedentes bacterium]|nr:hypothetical protein [Candidatus Hydrogenedentota bacterium]
MSTPSETLDARVGGVLMAVPIVRDLETTRNIIDIVNRRLAEIEAESTKIDTQLFALQAATGFAADFRELQEERAGEQRELARALQGLAGELRSLLEEARQAE